MRKTSVTCAIIESNQKVLVTQRSEKMKLPLKWEFPGGKVEKGETDERQDATKRSLIRTKLGSMGINKAFIMSASYEPEGEVIDERRRVEKGTPRKPRNRAVEFVKSQNKEGMMTRSGKTIAQHEAERGVPESDRPKKTEQTTADRLAARKQREAAAKANAQRAREEEERRRRLS